MNGTRILQSSKDIKRKQKWNPFLSIIGLLWRIAITMLSKGAAWWCSYRKERLSLKNCPHELQHARLPCLSLSPKVWLNSRLLSQWCHPIISTSVARFSCPRSFPASGSFLMSRLFESGGQSIGVSALASECPANNQDWFPLGLTG